MRDLRELPLDRILVSPSVLAADFTELAAESTGRFREKPT